MQKHYFCTMKKHSTPKLMKTSKNAGDAVRMRWLLMAAAACSIAASCGRGESPHSAQARNDAVQEAKLLLQTDTADTFALQRDLLHAESVRSRYLLMGDTAAATDFDEALRDMVRRKSPKLAKKLF